MTTPKYPVMELSSPYGDCTEWLDYGVLRGMFSLPYGDCTNAGELATKLFEFSPPYGDCTMTIIELRIEGWFLPP